MQRNRIVSALLLILGAALGLIISPGTASASDAAGPPSVPVEIAEPLVIERTAPAAPDESAEGPVATAPLPDDGSRTVGIGSVLLLAGALVVAVAGRRRWA